MTELKAPLRRVLRAPIDRERQEEICQRVQARRRAAASVRRRPSTTLRLVAATAAAALVALTGWWWLGHQGEAPPGPLRQLDGLPLASVEVAPGAAPRRLGLSDGAVIVVDPGARLEPLVNTAEAVTLRLSRGGAEFDVPPAGPRRWTIEAALVRVTVVGTRFRVERDGSAVAVEVSRGVVSINGELVEDAPRRLVAGDSVVLAPAAFASAEPTSESDAGEPVDAGAAVEVEAGPAAPRPRTRRSWRRLAREGEYDDAFEQLGAAGVAREARQAATMEELLTLADVARRSGHPREAVDPLERALRLHPQDRRAPVAAFTLGRLYLHFLGNPARAARAFERCIALGPPQALREDAHARLAQARLRAGDAAGARSAASRYLRSFPDGRWAAEARRLLDGGP